MEAYCQECGDYFEARGRWQKLCWDCWRRNKDNETYYRGYDAGFLAAKQNAVDGGGELDDQLLTDLIALCHPDRHTGREEKSNRVTQILLAIRNKRRQSK